MGKLKPKVFFVVSINLTISMEQKQELLEIYDLEERLNKIHLYLVSEIDSFQIEKKIKGRVFYRRRKRIANTSFTKSQ